MTVFTTKKASSPYFYRYQSAEHLDWLKPAILEHQLYVPSVAQLNDPADCRPKIKLMSDEEMVSFLKNDYIRRNPVLALDLLRKCETTIRTGIQNHGLDWFQRERCPVGLILKWNSFACIPSLNGSTTLDAGLSIRPTNFVVVLFGVANTAGPLFGEHVMEVVYGEYPLFDVNDSKSRSAISWFTSGQSGATLKKCD